jgi:hypothetical protein
MAAAYAFAYSLLTFALAAEADTVWLKVMGFIAGTWLAIAGAITGWINSKS